MNIVPISTKILIQQNSAKPESEGGILLPGGQSNSDSCRGVVVRTGEDVEYIKAGDKVMFAEMVGAIIKTDGKVYIVMDEKEIVAKYTD